jgi:hypothetical protein
LYPIELMLTKVLRESPSTELILCKKGPSAKGDQPSCR